MKKLVGFDINGWNDCALRNWSVLEGEDHREDSGVKVAGGLASATIVLSKGGVRQRFMGGPQAVLAPHGRGHGWGDIGSEDQRQSIAIELAKATNPDILAAAMTAIAPRPDIAVLPIPDDGTCSEMQRERLLLAMRHARIGRSLLVWRPVLALLAELDRFAGTTRVAVICHRPSGFTVQKLVFRHAAIPAPERKADGLAIEAPGHGYDALLRQAGDAIVARSPVRGLDQAIKSAQLPTAIALDLELPREELVRLPNADWELIERPDILLSSETTGLGSDHVSGCDAVLFETLCEGARAAALCGLIARDVGCDVQLASPNAVARGAFVAADRLAKGQPVYYDFLPNIATICATTEGPESVELIHKDAVLPAGAEYRSKVPARFVLPAKQSRIEVWLRRDGEVHPRKSEVTIQNPPPEKQNVELFLEQTPAAGRARLTLRSSWWSEPLVVNWQEAEVVEKEWDVIMAELERPIGIPDRMVLPCAIEAWEYMTQEALLSDTQNWTDLKDAFGRRAWGEHNEIHGYAVDSDGNLPSQVSGEARKWLDRALGLATEHIDSSVRAKSRPPEHALNFLTWCFRACPRTIVHHLLDAIEDDVTGHKRHPLRGPGQSRLWFHGLGRSAEDPADVRRAFDLLFAYGDDAWNSNHRACASFLLSRSEHGPEILTENEVSRLVSLAIRSLKANFPASPEQTLRYTPGMIAGLLRRRHLLRNTLLAGEDDLGTVAAAEVGKTIEKVDRLELRIRNKYKPLLEDLKKYLEGGEGRPDLLFALLDE